MENQLSTRAQKIFEERNIAFRILYDTILEISIEDNPEIIYKIICEKYRKICDAKIAFIIVINKKEKNYHIKAVSNDNKTMVYGYQLEVIKKEIAHSLRGLYKNLKQGSQIDNQHIERLLSQIHGFTPIEGKNIVYYHVIKNDSSVIEMGVAILEKRIKVNDLIDTFINMCTIILQRVMALNEVKVSNERFMVLLKHSPIGIMLINNRKKIIDVNDKALELFGLKREECLNASCYNRFCNKGKEHYLCESLNDKVRNGEIEKIIQNKKGRKIPVLVNVCLIEMDNEPYYLETIVDLTDRKKYEKEKEIMIKKLLDSQKQESIMTLAAGVAHEINTPLQSLENNIDFMSKASSKLLSIIEEYKKVIPQFIGKDELDNFNVKAKEIEKKYKLPFIQMELDESIEELQQRLSYITKTVEYMKDFTESEKGLFVQIEINEFVKRMVAIYCVKWEKEIDIQVNLIDKDIIVQGVSKNLKEVLMIIIDNAVDAVQVNAEKLPIIIINIYEKEEIVGISISDNGSGIKREIKDKIFEPFFTTKEIGKGTGQGLGRAHNIIIDQHKGNMYLESEENIGTTFYIELLKDLKKEL